MCVADFLQLCALGGNIHEGCFELSNLCVVGRELLVDRIDILLYFLYFGRLWDVVRIQFIRKLRR